MTWETHGRAYFVADIVSLFFLWLWPALKTIAAFRIKQFTGRYSEYWIGTSLITSLYMLIRPLLIYFLPGAYIVPIISFIISYNNGFLVRIFVNNVLFGFYLKYKDEILSIPNIVKSTIKKILNSPTAYLKAAAAASDTKDEQPNEEEAQKEKQE